MSYRSLAARRIEGLLWSKRERLRSRRDSQRLHLESLEGRHLLTVTAGVEIYTALEANSLNVPAPGVLANDSTNTGTALSVTNFTQPTNGTLTLNRDGSFQYLPTAGYVGPDEFSYTVADGQGETTSGTVTLTVNPTTNEASVFAGPRLASVSSTQSTLLNTVVGGLVGTNLNLSVADYDGLASGTINGGRLANALGAELGVTPSQALTTNATLAQVYSAAATVAQADGNTAEATAFTNLATSVSGLNAPVQLGNLLQVNPNDGSLANANLNALDLVNGTAQLFNFDNVATTPTPITVSGASLGLPNVVGSAAISAQVVEPPIITTGPTGTMFHSSAVRLKINLNLVDALDTTAITNALQTALGPAVTVAANGSLGQLQVYTEVAEGQGTIASINAIANSVTLQATPGLANVYLGNIADNVFFDRTHVINPATDVMYGNVGTLNISATTTLTGTSLANVSTAIQLKSSALGAAPLATTEVFNAPFPQSQTVNTSANFLTNLANTLVTNLSVQTSGTLGPLLDPLVNTVILPALRPIVTTDVTPLLTPVLISVADPTLQQLGTGIGELVLTVNAINQVAAPVANADFATTQQNQAVIVPVISNDATITGDPIHVSAVTQPTHGTSVINPDGTVTYTPTTGFVGTDTFTDTITDQNGQTSTGTVSITVLPPPPIAIADSYSATENIPLTIAGPGVLANDTDPVSNPLTAVIATNPTRGTVTLNADGSFTYTPTPNDFGTDTFTYRATDGTGFSAPVAVTINVQAAKPATSADAYTATAGTPLVVSSTQGVLANDTDPNGLPLTATLVTPPTHGQLTLNPDGSLSYVPTAGYVGTDSFIYHATDSNGAGNNATVTVNVEPGLPVGNPDTYTVTSGKTLTLVPSAGVLANDTDPNGLPLTATLVTMPTHGQLTLNMDGSLSYVPTAGYVGADRFTYRPTDTSASGNPVTVTINVQAAGQLGTPATNADAYTATAGTPLVVSSTQGVLANDTDPNGLPLTATLVTPPTHGQLTLNPDGSLSYVPTAGYVGTDSFIYHATDSNGAGNNATVTVNVEPGLPVGNPDTYTVTSGKTLTLVPSAGVLANDTDPNGLPLTATLVTMPTHGQLTLNMDGSLSYVPTAGYVGADRFTYRPTDTSASGNPVTVTINVQAAGQLGTPATNADAYTATAGTPLVVSSTQGVLANDTDPNGLPLTATLVTPPTHGQLTLNPDGSLSYVPTAGYVGTDSFIYHATDSNGAGNNATVTVNVEPGLPVGNPDTYTVAEGTPLTVVASAGVLANDTDPNGLRLSAVVATQPSKGMLTLNSDGSFTYSPNTGYVGPDSFTYRASDGTILGAPTTVTLVVEAGTGGSTNGLPPVVVTTFPVTGSQGVPITAVPVVTFTDGNGTTPPGSYTVTINWGDGTTPSAGTVTEANGVYEVMGDHTYAVSGTFPVSIVINKPGTVAVPATTEAVISPAQANASLSGYVFADVNGDGIREASEPGVFKATIILGGSSTSGQLIYYVTQTGIDGSYQFAGLPAGTYAIAEMQPNGLLRAMATSTVGQASVGSLGGTAGNRLTTSINVPSGAAGVGYNFSESATSSIEGRVYLEPNKNSPSSSNTFGVANIGVTLSGTDGSGQAVLMSTTTDASGNYLFTGVNPGVYQIQVARPGQVFRTGLITPGTSGGVVQGDAVTGITIPGGATLSGPQFGELPQPFCRLNTPALQTLLRVGPNPASLPSTFRPITLSSTGPIAHYLPTLAALATTHPTVGVQRVHKVRVAHAVPVHATVVRVQHGKAKPNAAARRHK